MSMSMQMDCVFILPWGVIHVNFTRRVSGNFTLGLEISKCNLKTSQNLKRKHNEKAKHIHKKRSNIFTVGLVFLLIFSFCILSRFFVLVFLLVFSFLFFVFLHLAR